jgi:predicted DNA-binding protein with PD1-like motif
MMRDREKSFPSKLTGYAFRLRPHEDLKQSIIEFASTNSLKAGAILSAVGSLEQFNIRFANQENGTVRKGFFEIISLTGTFSDSSCHLHISVSDGNGETFGGHLLDENIIYTTAEIVVVNLDDLEFDRNTDATYNYKELVVGRIKKQ